MRHGTSNNRRSRGRNNNNRGRNSGGNNRAQVFDSNGPEVRIRGTAHQIFEKYTGLAKDANSVGDLVLAESYLQHAEHYQRIISVWNEQNAASVAAAAEKRDNEKAYSDDNNKQADGNKKEAQNDDLSLPASILGGEVKVASEGVRASEGALEDA